MLTSRSWSVEPQQFKAAIQHTLPPESQSPKTTTGINPATPLSSGTHEDTVKVSTVVMAVNLTALLLSSTNTAAFDSDIVEKYTNYKITLLLQLKAN